MKDHEISSKANKRMKKLIEMFKGKKARDPNASYSQLSSMDDLGSVKASSVYDSMPGKTTDIIKKESNIDENNYQDSNFVNSDGGDNASKKERAVQTPGGSQLVQGSDDYGSKRQSDKTLRLNS